MREKWTALVLGGLLFAGAGVLSAGCRGQAQVPATERAIGQAQPATQQALQSGGAAQAGATGKDRDCDFGRVDIKDENSGYKRERR